MTGNKGGRSRRTALKTIGAASAGLLGVGSFTEKASARHMGPPGGGGDSTSWGQNSKFNSALGPETFHLGSGLDHMDSGKEEEFRVAGNFCTVGPNGEIPDFGGPTVQEVRVVNESPDALSVFTSHNPEESAMNPKPNNYDELTDLTRLVGTTAASLATTYVGTTAGSVALSLSTLITGLIGIAYDGGGGNTYAWNGQAGAPRGGHRVDFKVHEKAGSGTIKVESKIPGLNNAWRLSFDNGLSNVNKI
jgi:hypothetical protein